MMDAHHKDFYDRLAKLYPEETFNTCTPELQAHFLYICGLLDKMTGSFIELGCGKGRYVLHYAAIHPQNPAYGIDIAPLNCTTASLRAKLLGLTNISFIAADITEKQGFQGFDNLLCTETLEHLPHLGHAIHNIRNALKISGKALITVPHQPHRADGFLNSNEYLQAYGINDQYFHCGYTLPELKALFQPHFTVEHEELHGNKGWEKSLIIVVRKA